MRKVDRLKQEAKESCEWRGHNMGNFQRDGRMYHGFCVKYTSVCRNPGCSAYVQINTQPAANEIDIGGTAVALNCPTGAD